MTVKQIKFDWATGNRSLQKTLESFRGQVEILINQRSLSSYHCANEDGKADNQTDR